MCPRTRGASDHVKCHSFHSYITAVQTETETHADDEEGKLRDFYYFNLNEFITQSADRNFPTFLWLGVFMVNINKQSVNHSQMS